MESDRRENTSPHKRLRFCAPVGMVCRAKSAIGRRAVGLKPTFGIHAWIEIIMKTKINCFAALVGIVWLLPLTTTAQITLTGLKVFGLRADGTRDGSAWDTLAGGQFWGAYLFTGTPRSPKFLNGGDTDDSLNPKCKLAAGNQTFGFACDSAPSAGVVLELCFNNQPESRISITMIKGNSGGYSGTTAFRVGAATVTVTAAHWGEAGDLVSPHEAKPNNAPDTIGRFTLSVTQQQAEPVAAVTLTDFSLSGDLSGEQANFTLRATANVEGAQGGSLDLISGAVALTEVGPHPKWELRAESGRYVAVFPKRGFYPVTVKFSAAVRQNAGWSAVDFQVAPSALQPVVLRGLAADTMFDFSGAARTQRVGSNFVSSLSGDGAVRLAWKEARKEDEGKLFYAAEMVSQINVSPGLLRQHALFDFKIMQGELSQLSVRLHGAGEVTRVQGEQVLSWKVIPGTDAASRLLVVQLNQAQKERFALQVQTETTLGAFPQTSEVLHLQPEGATRFAGCLRVANEGAVRLEVAQATGLSQISPDQFPESEALRSAVRGSGTQRFAYRFSSAEYGLRVQADQSLPEVAVSEVLTYHHGENELTIDAELELEVREAPLRELSLRIPRGYAVVNLNASGMSYHLVRDLPEAAEAELRLIYGQPVSGRQVMQLRLERNKSLGETSWVLPRVEVMRAKSVRGNVGISAAAGFRVTAERIQALTEVAPAFFPRKVAGLQAAFRLSDPGWQATLRVERLPQTVQADAFHLFSIGEGVAYGSSVMNYVISGAPMATLRVELSEEYFNVEFTGKDVRNWQKTTNGYLVQLHSPVAGAYTLLATYERPFKSQGATLAFTGARPADAQSESGHTLVISAYQFQVKPVDLSPGLLALETGEVPAEYRLFFDAPILAAYRYTSRPFNLKLALSPLEQGKSLDQVVDRAVLVTQISKEGQVLTDASYFVKNRGNPNFRLTLPAGTELWAALVNGAPVVPVKDGEANLIPLPQRVDPNSVLKLDLKLAAKAGRATRLQVSAPIVNAPVMLAEWKLTPDAGQRLAFLRGSLTPVSAEQDISGFAQLTRMLSKELATRIGLAFGLVLAALIAWRWAGAGGVYRFSVRHVFGSLIGLVGVALAGGLIVACFGEATQNRSGLPADVSLLAPVQQAGSALTVEVSNVSTQTAVGGWMGSGLLVALAIGAWLFAWRCGEAWLKQLVGVIGWALLAWAGLQMPNGVPWFLLVILAFVIWKILLPAGRDLVALPAKPLNEPNPGAAVVSVLIGSVVLLNLAGQKCAAASFPNPALTPTIPEWVEQQVRIEEGFAVVKAKIRWAPQKGESLTLLREPAVITRLAWSKDVFQLVQSIEAGQRTQQLVAERSGAFDIDLEYQLQVTKTAPENFVILPTVCGLINRLELTVSGLDVEVIAPQAVSLQREWVGSNTVAQLLLPPLNPIRVGWKPRARDVKREKSIFYAELAQLYVPAAGVIEGVHLVTIRPAQGELTELLLDVPAGATVTDVGDGAAKAENQNQRAVVSLWRFDPDTRKLRVTLARPQSRAFTLLVRSQMATGPLPFEQTVGLVSVEGATGQLGSLGIATGNEVQLDTVTAVQASPINLEDFPAAAAQVLQSQLAGLTTRRAFRYADVTATATLKAAPVEAEVRVETQDTVSLGEDRTVLAASATVDITRAGIFRLSFVLPPGFDVESISGAALSHWTESKTETGRVITLNLLGKTDGRQQFSLNLAGPGAKATKAWSVPQVLFREASKQQGTLLVVPEQGMQLQAGLMDGLSQLDPQRSGIRQKGVLAFRILQAPWQLTLDIEQVDPWIQVTSLQHATVSEALIKVAANLQYQIENTGLKAVRVALPTNAESVRFTGDLVSDFLRVPGAVTNGMQQWEVKLQRRVIGSYLLQVNYQTLIPDQAAETVLRGIQATEVNLQRGFVTVQSGGRVQVTLGAANLALPPTEWQSIPRILQQNLQADSANFAFRLAEPAFQLALQLNRHEAVKLLPARVQAISFNSVISDAGVMLTQVRLDLTPGDKRLLSVKLPSGANYWFAFVNQNGVWPWRQADEILIPLDQQSPNDKPVPVELFYSSQVGQAGARALDLELLAPKFDLPLENISWRVYLNERWQVKHWSGTLQLAEQESAPAAGTLDLQSYLQGEVASQREKTQEAEQMLAFGNNALANGDPEQARRAFQSAYGLSTHDNAFNEDARVQLHNLKLQQALVGLNVRQAAATGDTTVLGTRFRDLRGSKNLNYTQQDAKGIMDRNSADDNAATMRLAEKLIQQQDAAVTTAAAIRANIPQQGRVLTFQRSVAVDKEADLRIDLRTSAAETNAGVVRGVILVAVLGAFGFLAWANQKLLGPRPA